MHYARAHLFSEETVTTTWTKMTCTAPIQSIFFGCIVVAIVLETVVLLGITAMFLVETQYTALENKFLAGSVPGCWTRCGSVAGG